MNAYLASHSPATDTAELSRVYRGPAVFDAPTEPISIIALKPPVHPIRRTIPIRVRSWSLLAAVTLGAGLAHLVAVTS